MTQLEPIPLCPYPHQSRKITFSAIFINGITHSGENFRPNKYEKLEFETLSLRINSGDTSAGLYIYGCPSTLPVQFTFVNVYSLTPFGSSIDNRVGK
ncbi:hypothetical protein Hanom_Chr00s000005g01612101 [Helianthus anomalus]